MEIFRDTGWRFVTAGGGEIDFGISKFLYVAGQAGAFYVKPGPQGTIWRLPFVAVVGGAE
jgi:hypothetical protein